MHLTRALTSRRIPVARKGTVYLARPLSHAHQSISVVAAVRDILHLGQTAREIKSMIHQKKLKINGRIVRDYREPLHLFNILEAGKKYKLSILTSGRFFLEETKDSTRVAKVIGKKVLRGKITQINLHDGTNILSKESPKIGDSLELDMSNKLLKIIPLEKGRKVFVESGRSIGQTGNVQSLEKSDVQVKLKDRTVTLQGRHLIAL